MEIYYRCNPERPELTVGELVDILSRLPEEYPVIVENGVVESVKVDNFYPEFSDEDSPYLEIL